MNGYDPSLHDLDSNGIRCLGPDEDERGLFVLDCEDCGERTCPHSVCPNCDRPCDICDGNDGVDEEEGY